MRFVDLNSGSVYNGDAPYIHWFDDNQSTNLIYVKKLCVLHDDEFINISLNSSIFNLLNLNDIKIDDENINEFTYKNIENFKVDFYTSKGYLYNKNSQYVYLHMIYIICSNSHEGEFLEDLYINDQKFIIGASFYDIYEPHKINLSNLGVELPESITRAIYETNVHEEYYDNILLNRKHKELLNEYWNIIANKGSYQSLYNSLAWFEYGDLIKIQELWKGEDHYNQQDIIIYLQDLVKNYLSNQIKSTYYGLYLSLQKIHTNDNGIVLYDKLLNDNDEFGNVILDKHINNTIGDYYDQILQIGFDNVNIEDSINDEVDYSDWISTDYKKYEGIIGESNPILIDISSKWSKEDLSLKMYLIGNFFETYFTPIHIDILHSTIENIVFTNTLKVIYENKLSRFDYYNNIYDFNCNIKDNDSFFLDDVNIQVNKDTIAGVQWISYSNQDIKKNNNSEYDSFPILGVDKTILKINNDDDLKTFMAQYYNSIGIIINFSCDLQLKQNDFIKELSIVLNNDNYQINSSFKFLKRTSKPSFNILCKKEGRYSINIQFSTASGCNYIKTIHFNIYDHTSKNIKLYKVKYNRLPEHSDKTKYLGVNDYLFSHYNFNEYNSVYDNIKNKKIISQFIPEYLNKNNDANYNGVIFNRTIIFRGVKNINDIIDDDNSVKEYIIANTKILYKYKYDINSKTLTDEITYTIFILPLNIPEDLKLKNTEGIYKDNYIFYPEMHHLEELYDELKVSNIDDFTITENDVLMIVPNVEYLKTLEENGIEWEFENVSLKNKSKPIKLPSIKTPFIANTEYKLLTPGYYNIKFRYKLGTNMQEISLNSAFRVI